MNDETNRDKPETDDEMDVEGQSMFLYEASRQMARQHEREAKQAAREAKLLKDAKSQNRK